MLTRVIDSRFEIPGLGDFHANFVGGHGDLLLLSAFGSNDNDGLFLFDGGYHAVAMRGIAVRNQDDYFAPSAFSVQAATDGVAVVFIHQRPRQWCPRHLLMRRGPWLYEDRRHQHTRAL